jgi:ferric-dicitrate binding protein FerR (iron transport regulator)
VASQRSTGTAAQINEAAAIWLLKMEAPASAQLRQEFQHWLDEEPRHRAAFVRLRFAWDKSERFRLLRPPDGSVDEDLFIRKL